MGVGAEADLVAAVGRLQEEAVLIAGDRLDLGGLFVGDLELARVLLEVLNVLLELVDAALVLFRGELLGDGAGVGRRGEGERRDERGEVDGKPMHVTLLDECCLRSSGQRRVMWSAARERRFGSIQSGADAPHSKGLTNHPQLLRALDLHDVAVLQDDRDLAEA